MYTMVNITICVYVSECVWYLNTCMIVYVQRDKFLPLLLSAVWRRGR